MKRRPNFTYSAVQGTYWMYFGSIMSFASVFLLGRKYTNTEIGMILSTASILAVILQPLLADAADRSRRVSLSGINAMITGGLILGTASLYLFTAKAWILTVIFIMLCAWHTSQQPLINSMAFHLSERGHRVNFGISRGIGSTAYAALTTILGMLVAAFGLNAIPATGIAVLVLLLISLAITDKFRGDEIGDTRRPAGYKESEQKGSEQRGESIGLKAFIVKNKAFMAFTFGIVILFFQNSVLNTYLLQIITAVGGTSSQMGRLLSFMALLELPGMFFFSNVRKRLSCRFLLKVSSAAFVMKILLTYLAASVSFIYLAFVFQLISFPFFLTAVVHLVDEVMGKGEAVKGQSFITGAITLSNVFASLLGGIILDHSGVPLLLMISTILAVLGTVIIFLTVGRIRPKERY